MVGLGVIYLLMNVTISHVYRGKALQESLIKLVEACRDGSHNMDRWLSKLENSKWLSHIQTALSTAGLLAECVERYKSHCLTYV